ncbi:MAG: hypothetical protein AABZ15_13195 [Nitrospirota bacterium]
MKKIFTILLLAAAVIVMLTDQALAAKNSEKQNVGIEVAIETRAGKVYDYILIGMHKDATDGLDNAYDTVTPGQGVSDQYILMVVPHPDWKSLKTDFRTDFRAITKSNTWEATVMTNLPDGTSLTMSIDQEQSKLPTGYAVIVEDMATGAAQDLEKGAYVFPVKTSGLARQFRITLKKDGGKDHSKKDEKTDRH